jgi:UDP-glucose 4-epimerase
MKAFISGGAGFVGSHLVRKLFLEARAELVVVYDNFSSGRLDYLRDVPHAGRLKIITGDIKQLDTLSEAMRGCDTVFHLAANPDIAKAVTQPDIDFWEGTYLTQNILEAMRLNCAKEIFYTSGSGVYGENASVFFSEIYGPCVPISTYGASKLACEALIASYCHMFGMAGRALRFANVVGPRQTHGVGYDFVRRLRQDPSRLRILGDGSQSKSYIHVDDILNAVFCVAKNCHEKFDIFNVATSDYVTVREIAEMAVELCGLPPGGVLFEFTGGDRGWKGDVPVVRFDCSKIENLGWRCSRTSGDALRDSMKAMLEEISYA